MHRLGILSYDFKKAVDLHLGRYLLICDGDDFAVNSSALSEKRNVKVMVIQAGVSIMNFFL